MSQELNKNILKSMKDKGINENVALKIERLISVSKNATNLKKNDILLLINNLNSQDDHLIEKILAVLNAEGDIKANFICKLFIKFRDEDYYAVKNYIKFIEVSAIAKTQYIYSLINDMAFTNSKVIYELLDILSKCPVQNTERIYHFIQFGLQNSYDNELLLSGAKLLCESKGSYNLYYAYELLTNTFIGPSLIGAHIINSCKQITKLKAIYEIFTDFAFVELGLALPLAKIVTGELLTGIVFFQNYQDIIYKEFYNIAYNNLDDNDFITLIDTLLEQTIHKRLPVDELINKKESDEDAMLSLETDKLLNDIKDKETKKLKRDLSQKEEN